MTINFLDVLLIALVVAGLLLAAYMEGQDVAMGVVTG